MRQDKFSRKFNLILPIATVVLTDIRTILVVDKIRYLDLSEHLNILRLQQVLSSCWHSETVWDRLCQHSVQCETKSKSEDLVRKCQVKIFKCWRRQESIAWVSRLGNNINTCPVSCLLYLTLTWVVDSPSSTTLEIFLQSYHNTTLHNRCVGEGRKN